MISFVEWSSSCKFLDITSVSDKANTEFIFCMFLAIHLQRNYYDKNLWASMQENLSSEFGTRSYPNQPAQLLRLARKLKYHLWQV